ncbi:hypothetical protein KJK32_47085 (plasmid) [Streptomyces sp. JCM17656]|nr:hypothetical protein KJK32_47085 [Streptomyces sp. JCM17656]
MDGKKDRLTLIAEYTRSREQQAQERVKQVTHRLEQARAAKGGEKLVATLTRLHESATVLAERAGQLHKRAVRACEASTTLIGNVKARYEEIYQAVIDSPETEPAEMSYYTEMDHAV